MKTFLYLFKYTTREDVIYCASIPLTEDQWEEFTFPRNEMLGSCFNT